MQGCICPPQYSGVSCETEQNTCELTCKGTCVDGTCLCSLFHFGVNCEFDCTPTGIRERKCMFNISNTNSDRCETINGLTVCYCAGGFEFESPDIMNLKAAFCDYCNQSDIDLVTCCAPGNDCSDRKVCTDSNCCSGLTTQADCNLYGCGWCRYNGQCYHSTSEFCPLELIVYRPFTSWMMQTVHKNDWNDDYLYTFDEGIRDTYLGIYTLMYQKFGASTHQALVEARSYLGSLMFPSTYKQTPTPLGQNFKLSVMYTNGSTFCDNGVLSYIAVGRMFEESGAVTLTQTCDENKAVVFFFRTDPQCNAFADESLSLGFYVNSALYCQASVFDTQVKLDSYTQSDADISSDISMGISLEAYFMSLISVQNVCANVIYDTQLGTFTNLGKMLTIDEHGEFAWRTSSNIQLTIIR